MCQLWSPTGTPFTLLTLTQTCSQTMTTLLQCRGQHAGSAKGQRVRIFSFSDHTFCLMTTQFCPYSLKTAIDHE